MSTEKRSKASQARLMLSTGRAGVTGENGCLRKPDRAGQRGAAGGAVLPLNNCLQFNLTVVRLPPNNGIISLSIACCRETTLSLQCGPLACFYGTEALWRRTLIRSISLHVFLIIWSGFFFCAVLNETKHSSVNTAWNTGIPVTGRLWE